MGVMELELEFKDGDDESGYLELITIEFLDDGSFLLGEHDEEIIRRSFRNKKELLKHLEQLL